ncbi:MAG: exosortase/archaeosortase family protein [Planctomycetales bacterium]|nr:exosortase/archaeosortase family protein [Planctomycetales bacterium]
MNSPNRIRTDTASKSTAGPHAAPPAANARFDWPVVAVLIAGFLWAYWPTLVSLVQIWDREPDYSHGFLVIPLAGCFLWLNRERRPGFRLHWIGLLVIALSIGLRTVGIRFAIDSVDGYSILAWAAGVALLLGGGPMLRWAAPAIMFLFFMVPLPFRIEILLSQQLQSVATQISCFVLQLLGQPAFAENTTILLGDQQLKVEQACSGMRIFFGTFALAFAYIIFVRRELWEIVILLLSAAPIALIVNSLRIVATGLLYQNYSGEMARKFSHDISGWVMIPLAAALFGLLTLYLNRLVRETSPLELSELVNRKRSEA